MAWMVLFGFASPAWLLEKAAELRVCQEVLVGLKCCSALPQLPGTMSSPALSSELLLFLSRADRAKKICSHLLGMGSRAAWSCLCTPSAGRQSPALDSFPHSCSCPSRMQLLEADESWAGGRGAGIKEREVEGGMAGAPGPHPAAPGLFPRWK